MKSGVHQGAARSPREGRARGAGGGHAILPHVHRGPPRRGRRRRRGPRAHAGLLRRGRSEARGRGHAARLLDRAEQGCREAGVRALHLEVEPDKAETYAWYRRRGFADHERRLMTKWLAPGPGKEDP
ncbi:MULTISPECIES: GNAT family N-acetyltransferase [Sorangium]|uniref:GNAT family N-acetyltransferase n=1 Tax=Sorangium TaxID=39643 RepID=UPI003D9C0240